jgi:hypothetical protein
MMCGVAPGEIDELTRREARFHVGHHGGENQDAVGVLQGPFALCTSCRDGATELVAEKVLTARLRPTANRVSGHPAGGRIAELLKQLGTDE